MPQCPQLPNHVHGRVHRPGAYEEGNAWLKHKHHYAPPPGKQRVEFKRVSSAPSIPARDQSYGEQFLMSPRSRVIVSRDGVVW